VHCHDAQCYQKNQQRTFQETDATMFAFHSPSKMCFPVHDFHYISGFWLMRTIAENQAEGKGEEILVALSPLSALFITIPFVYTEKSPRLRT